ncbi:hypothetical protein ACFL4G_05290 [Thermodesulfobacteriota bacterium]
MHKNKSEACLFFFAILITLTAIVGVSLAETRTRIGLIPKDENALSLTKDQITFTVSNIDMTNYKEDTNVWSHYQFEGKNRSTVSFDDVACQPPFFKIVVQNNSDQTLKLRSRASGSSDEVIVVIDDETGNTIEALRKEKILETLSVTYKRFAEKNASNPQEAVPTLISNAEAMLNRLPLLTEDKTILPGRRATFYTCFEYVPGASDEQEVNEWFKDKNEITLGFYDVPVARDAAGVVQKKTSYQFTFKVAEWREQWEIVKKGKKRTQEKIKSERIR